MIQEIITYMILGAAIALSLSGFLRSFRKKNRKDTELHGHSANQCASCSAECMVRDMGKSSVSHDQNCEILSKQSE